MMTLEKTSPAPRVLTPEYYARINALDEKHGWYRGMREVTLRLIERFCQPRESLRILDAGCGTGGLLAQLVSFAGPGGMLVGLDLAPEALQFCRQRGAPGLVQSSVVPLPFRDSSFHLITCSDVLQHLEGAGDQQALEEFYRVLQLGGVVVLRVAAGVGSPRYSHRYYQVRELARQLTNAGFAIEKLSYLNQLSYWAQALRRKADRGFVIEGLPEIDSKGASAPFSARWWKNWLIFYSLKREASRLSRSGHTYNRGTSIIGVARKPLGNGSRG